MDVFRLVPTRHIGHAWAFSEAITEIILPEHINFCYFVTGVYMITHASWNGFVAKSQPIVVVAETIIFDTFASVILPTILTATVYRLTRRALKGISPHNIAVYISTGLSLFSLMSLYEHIDEFIDSVLDATVRAAEEVYTRVQ